MLLRALVSVIGMIMIACMLTYAGCAAIATPISEYGQAQQVTEQTRIEWDAKVEIEEIRADAGKKTDFSFVVFWVVRFLAWALGVVVLGMAALLGIQKYLEATR